ncbi:SHOCT domain-containing protein [Natronorarus salvus]|uniref:SHOCT domain-containing protein n=1 Tax=Natronorarus salvus TaxID=3117733 RepID=UPI002F266835
MTTTDTLVRLLVLIVAVVLLVPFLMMLLMAPMMGMGWWGPWGDPGMWDGTGVWWPRLVMQGLFLLVLLVIGYLIYWGFVHSSHRERDAALRELRMAYARGDLSNEEFEERRTRLQREE